MQPQYGGELAVSFMSWQVLYFAEVRLKEHGSDLIEVVDNGCGVEESATRVYLTEQTTLLKSLLCKMVDGIN